jgi:putative lipoic acid-binding regulatory protein
MAVEEKEAKMAFPCDYGIKAMGVTCPEFDAIVVSIVRRHIEELKEGAISRKQSAGGKFTSISVDFYVESREQLEAIHSDLISHELIKYVL